MKIQKRPNIAETKSDLENPTKQRLVSQLRNTPISMTIETESVRSEK